MISLTDENLISTVFVLKDVIGYQEGSVVSRQLIKKESGNITLFSFDKGEGLSEHTAPFDALVYILDGKAEITIEKKKATKSKCDLLFNHSIFFSHNIRPSHTNTPIIVSKTNSVCLLISKVSRVKGR